MLLGFNTYGMAYHDLFDAVERLAEIGYASVGIAIDQAAMRPNTADDRQHTQRLQRLLDDRRMRSVIETGGCSALASGEQHQPTLISADPTDRRRTVDFYKFAVDRAAELGSDCVSLGSGHLPVGIERDQGLAWLVAGLQQLLEYAASRQVSIAFEPEPGMLIDAMPAWEQLLALPGMDDLCLTLDIGHLHCQGEGPIDEMICRWASRLINVHISDMRAGVHDHLMLGEGEIDFPTVFGGFSQAGYAAGIHLELGGHSPDVLAAARQALDFMRNILRGLR